MEILITGSIAYDYLMKFPGRFKEYLLPNMLDKVSLSFLVDSLKRNWGGVAANIAYNLALLGEHPKVMATAGRDFDQYREWLESHGVDTSAVIQVDDVFTASFFATTDLDNNQIASFYTGAMAYAKDHSIRETVGKMPDMVVISPNDPQAMTNYANECAEAGVPFMFDPSQQVIRLDADFLRHGIEHAHTLVVNEYEFELTQEKTGWKRDDILKRVKVLIVTLGEQGAVIYADGDEYRIPTVPPKRIADPTGVGDAFRAGVLKGMARGWPWDVTGRVGALCATYVLEQEAPQGHSYTPQEFVARYREYFDDDGVLDELLSQSP